MHISEVLSAKSAAGVVTIRADASVGTLVDLLNEHNIGAVVVSDDGRRVTGIVSERDIVRRLTGPDLLSVPVAEIMTADVHVCSPRGSLEELMGLMTNRRVRHLPVVDDDELIGIVSIGDLVKARMGELEFERDQLNDYVASGG